MADFQEQVKDICRLADAVIQNPITPITSTANSIGVCSTVAVFAAGGQLILSPLLMGPVGLVIAAGNWIFKKIKEKEKQQQEKERMLREVIRKQQAVIEKLNKELAKSKEQNAKNHQEILNLKQMLSMLEVTEVKISAA
ncbi:hypothetical protein F7D34_11850 [Prevotella copri]|uniref:Uncharacterized protein n=1 Tax=Segatella copri TaxID=165179 RepID=A0A646HN46_9BACT|nr:hypothetical protein [Segatella copri]MQN89827.1 hypothetical protein [Segatella copri]MQO78638.1 hypothetical protein [Segatella copri]